MTNLTVTLQELVASVDPLLELTNSVAQLSGITNLGAEVANITNSLAGFNWQDITDIRTIVSAVTNDLALLENLRDFDPAALTNAFGGAVGDLTNLSVQVDGIFDAVQDFNWDVLLKVGQDVDSITNSLNEITGLDGVAATLRGLTNSIEQLSGITNLGAEVANVTNALNGLNWDDVLDIQAKVNSITNTLAALSDIDELSVIMQGLTNSLADLSGVTNLEDRLSIVQDAVTNIVWSDITRMSESMADLTNNLAAVTDFGGSLTNLTGSLDALIGITNLNKSVDDLAETFENATWTDVEDIKSQLTSLSKSLGGLDGVDLSSYDSAALARIEQELGRIQTEGSSAVLGDIEALLSSDASGSSDSSGSSGDESLSSRLDAISRQLDSIGTDASDAATLAQSAKSQAASAAGAAQAAQQAIESGNLDQAMSAIRQVLAEVNAAQNDLRLIPKDAPNSEIFARVRTMADTIDAWAEEFGLVYPRGFTPPKDETGGTAAEPIVGGSDDEQGGGTGEGEGEVGVGDLSASIQEMRISMEFLRKMIEEVAYQPVVEEALLAIE